MYHHLKHTVQHSMCIDYAQSQTSIDSDIDHDLDVGHLEVPRALQLIR